MSQRKIRKRRLLRQQGGRCFYCKIRMVTVGYLHNPRRFTFDHKHPGGASVLADDVVGACLACNSAKSNLDFAVFVRIMELAPTRQDGHRRARDEQSRRDRERYEKACAIKVNGSHDNCCPSIGPPTQTPA